MREEKHDVVVSVRLAKSVKDGLEALAKADRRKLGSFLALVLEDYLAERQRPATEKPAAERKGKR